MNRSRSNSYSGSTHYTEVPVTNATTEELHQTESWQEVTNRKRLRSSPEAVIRNQKQTKLSYWLAAPIPTSNSFAELGDDDQLKTTEPKTKQTDPLHFLSISLATSNLLQKC